MNCRDFESAVKAGELLFGGGPGRDLAAHASGCAACHSLLDEERRLVELVDGHVIVPEGWNHARRGSERRGSKGRCSVVSARRCGAKSSENRCLDGTYTSTERVPLR